MRAVGRALAETAGGGGALAATASRGGALACRAVTVSKSRRVRFAEPAGGAADALALARDLRERGAARLAEQLAAAYALAADDYALLQRLEPPEGGERFLLAVGGLVASGKSTVAKLVTRRLGAPRVVADDVRAALLDGAEDAAHELAWASDLADRVYAGLLARGGEVLASGRSVVLDACFPTEARRRAAAALAARHGVHFVFAVCDAPLEDMVARLRLRDRRDGGPPGGWDKIAREVARTWEPPRRGAYVPLDTSFPRAAWLRALGLGKRDAP